MRTLSLLALSFLVAALPAQQRREGNLKVGDVAADFTIQDVSGKQTVQLAALKGKPVVLIFGSCT
jgi:cytochrome oxidase Cu insertion factor (SCO1/SenC/PrrC family)